MTDRTTKTSASGTFNGPTYVDEIAERIKSLMDAAAFPLTAVSGTNDVEASVDPVFDSDGLVDGMKFSIAWPAVNTDAVTLDINGVGATDVFDKQGQALAAGALAIGMLSLLEYRGGSFYCLSDVLTTSGEGRYHYTLTANGTWEKPSGLDDNRLVFVEAWGGGGGGGGSGNAGGGGGAAYAARWIRAADIGDTEDVVIGTGGAPGSHGTATTFGALLTAAGGLRGQSTSGGNGGGSGPSGTIGAGLGGVTNGDSGGDATTTEAGAGGAAGNSSGGGRDGGEAVFGGGGGGSKGSSGSPGEGGASSHGGPGGDSESAGVVPGGGGGALAAGARGEIHITIP